MEGDICIAAWYLQDKSSVVPKHFFVAVFAQKGRYCVTTAWGATHRSGCRQKAYRKEGFRLPEKAPLGVMIRVRKTAEAYAQGIVDDKILNRHHQSVWSGKGSDLNFQDWYDSRIAAGDELNDNWPEWWLPNNPHYKLQIGEEQWRE